MNIIEQTETFSCWFYNLKDPVAFAQIARRIERAELGNFGDSKSVGNGVFEMRINTGKGYRLYYAQRGKVTYLLLCGGDKSTQSKDIEIAKKLWEMLKNS